MKEYIRRTVENKTYRSLCSVKYIILINFINNELLNRYNTKVLTQGTLKRRLITFLHHTNVLTNTRHSNFLLTSF